MNTHERKPIQLSHTVQTLGVWHIKASRSLGAVLASTLLAAVAVSCSSPAPVDDAPRYDGKPITLTIGTDDSPGKPSADAIGHFASEVASLSSTKITIEPRWHAEGDQHPTDWDQAIVAMVEEGTLDLALTPTSAWDVLGVTSLQPIQSPFLIDSDQLVAAVVEDEDLSSRLMSGLRRTGVQGISLWPEGLRHPFGFDKALTSPRDYAGQIIRSPKSAASTMLFRALDASTTAVDPDATTMVGTQSEYRLSPNGIGVANITFFPKINVLYASAKTLSDLDPRVVDLLEVAAERTRTWAIGQTDDIAAGQAFCAAGGTVVTATDRDVDELKAATASVVNELAAAEGNRSVVDAIWRLKRAAQTPKTATACTAVPLTQHEPGKAEARLNGAYRYTLTPRQFLNAGLTESDAFHNAGELTYTLANGRIHFRLDPSEHQFGKDSAGPDETDGTYQVDGHVLTIRFPAYDNEIDRMLYAMTDDGDLKLTTVAIEDAQTRFLLTAKAWKKTA